jgi:hypothetical protein
MEEAMSLRAAEFAVRRISTVVSAASLGKVGGLHEKHGMFYVRCKYNNVFAGAHRGGILP